MMPIAHCNLRAGFSRNLGTSVRRRELPKLKAGTMGVPVSTAARINPFLPENLTISLSGSFTYIPAIPSTTTLQLPSTRA